MKLLHYFLSIIFITSSTIVIAKPAQFYKPYKSKIDVENIQPKKYELGNINVTLSSKKEAINFLTQEEIHARYIQKLTEELKNNNLLADEQTIKPITLNFDIQQKRIFAGEDLEFISPKIVGKYAHSTLIYQSNLKYNNQELAELNQSEVLSIGKKGSLSKIIRDLSGKGKPENELEDIDAFAHYMINQIPK
ncbi:MAG: hypothetical protein H9855_08760 [Candidatus Acinetobacter avistercoris]|uniref:hypothetical protein n=1 Tax=Acinetobacter sp. KS-LM10 TaxID=3120518 RepID=UPI001F9775FD|nr:hypothetical protein [Candidatus Acinetobacter avistercoris]